MSSAQGRINIAEAHLAYLGDPQPGEPTNVTEKREHYRQMLREAHTELGELIDERKPYKDDE